MPTDKITAVGAAGALALLVAWLLSLAGIIMPAAEQTALTVVLMVAAGYIKSERRGKHE